MEHRTLGRTDIRLSEIALGTWGLASGAYGPVEPARFEAVVKTAFDRGVTTFDMAPLWGDGESERRVAAGLGEERSKEAIFIVRAGQQRIEERISARFDSQSLIESAEASLTRLGRDRLDVFMLHNPPLKVLQSDLFAKGIEHLTASGKVRAWGVTVGTADEARLAMKIGAQVIGIVHNLLEPDAITDLAPTIKNFGAGVITRSPLAYGLLAGRWAREHTFAEDDHRRRRWDPSSLGERIDQLEKFRFLVHDRIKDLATVALRFALSSPFVSTVVVGARTTEQIAHASAASVAPPYFPEDDLELLADALG